MYQKILTLVSKEYKIQDCMCILLFFKLHMCVYMYLCTNRYIHEVRMYV